MLLVRLLGRFGACFLALYFLLPFYASARELVRLVLVLAVMLWLFLVNDRVFARLEPWSLMIVDGQSAAFIPFIVGRFVISLRLSLFAALFLGVIVAATEWVVYRIYPRKDD
ncbi:MAG: hypothetical protein PHV61_06385 [Limnochordia bacterium]|nr:hypothetical protein [Limnochordia bacterium]MDD2629775.1 hypothetical protein [Limnochordia bacterium]MDD4518009.1 hypothetical protein [Limnochordia bacterium]